MCAEASSGVAGDGVWLAIYITAGVALFGLGRYIVPAKTLAAFALVAGVVGWGWGLAILNNALEAGFV